MIVNAKIVFLLLIVIFTIVVLSIFAYHYLVVDKQDPSLDYNTNIAYLNDKLKELTDYPQSTWFDPPPLPIH